MTINSMQDLNGFANVGRLFTDTRNSYVSYTGAPDDSIEFANTIANAANTFTLPQGAVFIETRNANANGTITFAHNEPNVTVNVANTISNVYSISSDSNMLTITGPMIADYINTCFPLQLTVGANYSGGNDGAILTRTTVNVADTLAPVAWDNNILFADGFDFTYDFSDQNLNRFSNIKSTLTIPVLSSDPIDWGTHVFYPKANAPGNGNLYNEFYLDGTTTPLGFETLYSSAFLQTPEDYRNASNSPPGEKWFRSRVPVYFSANTVSGRQVVEDGNLRVTFDGVIESRILTSYFHTTSCYTGVDSPAVGNCEVLVTTAQSGRLPDRRLTVRVDYDSPYFTHPDVLANTQRVRFTIGKVDQTGQENNGQIVPGVHDPELLNGSFIELFVAQSQGPNQPLYWNRRWDPEVPIRVDNAFSDINPQTQLVQSKEVVYEFYFTIRGDCSIGNGHIIFPHSDYPINLIFEKPNAGAQYPEPVGPGFSQDIPWTRLTVPVYWMG